MVLEAMAVLEQQQFGLVDRRGLHLFRQRVGHSGREGDEEGIVEQIRPLDLAAGIRQREQHAIELAAVQRLAGGGARLLAEEQLQIGPLRAKPREQGRQQERGDGGDDAEAQLAGQRLARGAHHVGQVLGLAQDPPRFLGDAQAERAEADDPAGALHQGHADQGLKLLDPRGKRRLGDEAGLGRAPEMAVRVQGDEVLELFQGREVDAHRLTRSIRPI